MGNSATFPFGPIPPGAYPFDNTGGKNLGYYTTETTQRYQYGAQGMTWNGKVFVYCRAIAKLAAGYGAFNLALADVSDIINTATPAAISAGDTTFLMVINTAEGYGSAGAVAKDELVGSEVVIGHGSQYTTEQRTIIANTANVSGTNNITVTVDFPFALDHDAAVACECPLNHYRYCGATSEYASVVCVPNVVVAATGYNFWGQKKGPCWCVPGGGDTTPGDTSGDRMAYFVADGSVNCAYALTIETGYQIAGYVIDTTESGTGVMPLVMLNL